MHCYNLLALVEHTYNAAPCKPCLFRDVLVLADLEFNLYILGLNRLLKRWGSHSFALFKSRKILVVDNAQNLVDIDLAIQEHVGVGGRIEAAVAVDKFLIAQIRNLCRIAAGYISIRRIREQMHIKCADHKLVGVCHSALHLVEDNALVAWFAVFVKLVMPALLMEDFRLGVDKRAENSVEIYARKVHKVLIVAAANGINGLIRIGHRV